MNVVAREKRNTTETVARGYLSVRQMRRSTVEIELPPLDCIIVFGSWEPRALEVSHIGQMAGAVGVAVGYVNEGTQGQGRTHLQRLQEWLSTRCARMRPPIYLDTLDEISSGKAVSELVEGLYAEFGRPVSVAIDFSCCPKLYFLSMIAQGFSLGQISRVFALYSEPVYELKERSSFKVEDGKLVVVGRLSHFSSTEGAWRPVTVPYLDGSFNPAGRRRVVASLGFEGGASHQVIAQYDPDELVPLLASPGFYPEYTTLAGHENARLLKTFEVSPGQIVGIGAGDVCGVFAWLVDAEHSRGKGNDVVYLCFGPKTHSLGIGLASLVLGHPSVVCRIPNRFLEGKTKPNGFTWVYEILDTSIWIP